MAVLGLRFCVRAFSSCGKRGPLFIAVHGPLTIAPSLVAEHRLQTRRLTNCGSRAQLLRGMWDPPRPGLKPVSPALAGRLSTTAPPGKPRISSFWLILSCILYNKPLNLSVFLISVSSSSELQIWGGGHGNPQICSWLGRTVGCLGTLFVDGIWYRGSLVGQSP